MLTHPDFIRHRNEERELSRKDCVELFNQRINEYAERARKNIALWMSVFTTILGLLVGTLIYIFNQSMGVVNDASASIRNLNGSVVELTIAVESMKNQTARLQQENDRNRDGIDKLREQFYRK